MLFETCEAIAREALLPNSFAYFALFAWPLVSLGMFVRWPVDRAAIWSLMAGYLLLPSATAVDLPLVPSMDKYTIPAVSTFLLCCTKGRQSQSTSHSSVIYLIVLCLFFSPILSTLNNSYELQIGNRSLPGFYPLDGLKLACHNLIMIFPFLVGMWFLNTSAARMTLVKSLPVAGILYSIPMLVEVRLSPQLHRWVYGFFPNDFKQQYRGGGFRPVVFLDHGLEVALFTAMAVIAALVISKARLRVFGKSSRLIGGYLAIVLLLCKSLGATLYTIVVAPICLFSGPKTWVRFSVSILLLMCSYPFLRTFDLIPVHHITALADAISTDRASSFQMRVRNEDILVAKANEKPFFGWGTWGRNRVYQQGSGEDESVTDGGWIIQFGMYGWFGYLAYFGLFAASVIRARLAVRGAIATDGIVVGGLSLLVAINMVDFIANGWLVPFTYLAAGSVAGSGRARSRMPSKFQDRVSSRPAVAA